MVSGADLFLGLLNNLVVLILLVAVYGALINRMDHLGLRPRQLVMGVAFGIFAIICMYVKIPVADGVIVDQRNVIVALSGAFGGPLAALVSAAFAGAYRLHLGGGGAYAGVIGVLLAAFAGTCMYWLPQSRKSLPALAASSFLATVIIMPGFLFVGNFQAGWDLMVAMTPPFGTAVFIGIFMGSYLLCRENRQRRIERERANAEQERLEAFHEVMRANRAKSDFLATMSHELRTPLNAIIGFSDLLQMEERIPLPAGKRHEYASHIHASGQHLLSLINDVLDISTIEAGKRTIHKQPFDLNNVLKTCIANFANDFNADRVSLDLDTEDRPITIHADERAVAQIILNLLSNAVKFSNNGKPVKIKVRTETDRVTIAISDLGMGIPEDRIATITEPFSRPAAQAYLTAQGTGLGLSIVKSLVDLHGGDLRFESKEGIGTTVTVSLPRTEIAAPKRRVTDQV